MSALTPTPSSASSRPARSEAVGSPWQGAALPLRCGQPHLKLPAASYDPRQWPGVLRAPVWEASKGTSPRGELNGSKLKRDLRSGPLCFGRKLAKRVQTAV